MEDPAFALAEIAWDVLQRLIHERLSRKAGGHLIEGAPDRLILHQPLTLRGHGSGPDVFSRTLVQEIDLILDDAIRQAAAFHDGRISRNIAWIGGIRRWTASTTTPGVRRARSTPRGADGWTARIRPRRFGLLALRPGRGGILPGASA